ncbi:phospholipase [Microbacterium hominis]|uniref:Phospholipase n=2 Tax=Microbacterium hominis TaxID=162426 RepID=A0A7D4QEX8_9MICO|nr:phospholipase [Microbacterium hominis]
MTRVQRARARRRNRSFLTASVAVGAALTVVLTTGSAAATMPVTTAASIASVAAPVAAALPAAPQPVTLDSITAEAEASVADARAALRDAAAVTGEVNTSGLDLGTESTDIDVADLREAIHRLDDLDVLPVLLLPQIAEEIAAETDAVSARVDALTERLDAALEKKAAEEAAAKAAAEKAAAEKAAAEKKAAEEAARAAALAAANTPDGARATARSIAASEYGWGDGEFACLDSLWNKESNWNYQAYNASSGATGIPQSLPGSKMATAGADWQTNATTQIRWGLGYIAAAYGSPCSAWSHSVATNWY